MAASYSNSMCCISIVSTCYINSVTYSSYASLYSIQHTFSSLLYIYNDRCAVFNMGLTFIYKQNFRPTKKCFN